MFFATEAYHLRNQDELICMYFTEERVHSRHSFLMEVRSRNSWGMNRNVIVINAHTT